MGVPELSWKVAIAGFAVGGAMALAPTASHANVYMFSNPASGLNLSSVCGSGNCNLGTLTFTGSPTEIVLVRDGPTTNDLSSDFPNQGNALLSGVATVLGENTSAFTDVLDLNNVNGAAKDTGTSFNVLALHQGQSELLAYFQTAVTSFSISNSQNQWSNAHFFTDSATPTTFSVSAPEPASLALLGTAFVGFAAFRRCRRAV
jgi:hypothetical protein